MGQLKVLKNAHGKVLPLGGADVERKPLAVKDGEHLADAGKHRVVLPAFAVVAGSVVAGQCYAGFVGCVRHQLYGPLLDGRADETVQRARIADLVGFDYLAQAADYAGFGVSEGSIEVKDQGRK